MQVITEAQTHCTPRIELIRQKKYDNMFKRLDSNTEGTGVRKKKNKRFADIMSKEQLKYFVLVKHKYQGT